MLPCILKAVVAAREVVVWTKAGWEVWTEAEVRCMSGRSRLKAK
jgi:hypothetical protein